MEKPRDKGAAIICDLDGTLCLFDGRGPFEFERLGTDTPSRPVVATLEAFKRDGYEIVLVSGRFEQYRAMTVDWLQRHRIKHDALYLRPDGDYRKDAEIKPELFHERIEQQYDVVLALDDRNQSVACWRSLGIACFQV